MRSILKYDTNRINAHCNSSTKKYEPEKYLEMPLLEITRIC